MSEKPPSGEELALAKDSLVRSLPAEFETSGRVTNSTSNIYLYDLGLDYYTKLPARLSAITTDQVKSAAEKYIVPGKAGRDRGRRPREDRRGTPEAESRSDGSQGPGWSPRRRWTIHVRTIGRAGLAGLEGRDDIVCSADL